MSLDPRQKVAQLEQELARAREAARKAEDGQKFVIGGMVINAARRNAKMTRWLLDESNKTVRREEDQRRIKPLIEELTLFISADKDAARITEAKPNEAIAAPSPQVAEALPQTRPTTVVPLK